MSFPKVFLNLLISVSALTAAKESFQYYSASAKSFKEIQVLKFEGANISASCVRGKVAKCDAWSAFQKKAKYPDRKKIGAVGNPSAIYCAAYKAQNIIFLDSKKREFDFCVFADSSAIDAWDLYNAHHK